MTHAAICVHSESSNLGSNLPIRSEILVVYGGHDDEVDLPGSSMKMVLKMEIVGYIG